MHHGSADGPPRHGGPSRGLVSAAWLLLALASPAVAAAGDRHPAATEHASAPISPVALRRLWREVREAVGARPPPARRALITACDGRPPCIARALVLALGPRARLERVMHPDTDTIRMVHPLPTVTAAYVPRPGVLRLRLARFGRRALREMRAALSDRPDIRVLELDLRGHPGGSLRNMLRLAGGLLGPLPRALALRDAAGNLRWIDIPGDDRALLGARAAPLMLRILVDGDTASSAEVFTALMRRHAAARVLGTRTRGKDWLLRPVAVSHDWRLLVPAERIVVPGERIAGGLRPDAPPPRGDVALAP